jgi:methionyl-tRNA formyltransferase
VEVNLAFCGTPQFAVPTLRALAAGHAVKLVVTRPDRPAGRGLEVIASPVKQLAQQLGIPITQPEKIKNNSEFRAQLETIKPDAIIVVAYGRIIPAWMIELPRFGNINLHASLLPKYRGAAPIQWAIANGETVTGVTTMQIDEGLDTGAMLLRREAPILPEDTAVTLSERLAEIGAPLMLETLRGFAAGTIHPEAQDNSQATLAPLLKKEDGQVDFTRSAAEIYNRFRGFQPWPGAYTKFRGSILKFVALQRAASVPAELRLAPGTLAVLGERLLVGAGEGTAIELLMVQAENRKPVSAAEFVRGSRLAGGEQLG